MTPKISDGARRVMAISSGGGHWVQLLRLRPAFDGHDVTWVTVNRSSREDLDEGADFRTVRDASRWNRVGLVVLAAQIIWLLVRVRPDVIVSTGAAPGFLALRVGKILRSRTVWIDSIANVEELSLSGSRILTHADLCLTQWPHLAHGDSPEFRGTVL